MKSPNTLASSSARCSLQHLISSRIHVVNLARMIISSALWKRVKFTLYTYSRCLQWSKNRAIRYFEIYTLQTSVQRLSIMVTPKQVAIKYTKKLFDQHTLHPISNEGFLNLSKVPRSTSITVLIKYLQIRSSEKCLHTLAAFHLEINVGNQGNVAYWMSIC